MQDLMDELKDKYGGEKVPIEEKKIVVDYHKCPQHT